MKTNKKTRKVSQNTETILIVILSVAALAMFFNFFPYAFLLVIGFVGCYLLIQTVSYGLRKLIG